jgi:hypothetical protein
MKKAEELKKQMLRAKDINKKGLLYLQKLEKMGFEYDRKEMLSMD